MSELLVLGRLRYGQPNGNRERDRLRVESLSPRHHQNIPRCLFAVALMA